MNEIKEQWTLVRKGAPYAQISAKFGIDQVTARVMRNRGIEGDASIQRYLHATLDDLYDPALMKGIPAGATFLQKKIAEQAKIRIIGDYDIDGVCASYILYDALRRLGANVDYEIPDRMKDGYGLNIALVDLACAEGVDTILTCDNGISAIEQIAHAKDLGMHVVLTDHHAPLWQEEEGERVQILPAADVVINPHQDGDTYPYPDLCGAVVAWKLIWQLMRLYGREAEYLDYLPFAAFATIGDVMDLREENRIIVRYGLRALSITENLGMQALIAKTGILERSEEISSYHVGFILGPCINAAGRLDTAKRSLRLLLSRDKRIADELAAELVELNQERKELTAKGEEEAMDMLTREPYASDRVLVIVLPTCSESIAGIVAGRVRERSNKPVFILTRSQKEGILKGSGRSTESYDMHAHMVEFAALMEQFGGHPMAAGLSIKEENVEAFRIGLNERCQLSADDLARKFRIDVDMPIDYISERVIEDLHALEPCGKGNEKPVFAQLRVHALKATVRGAKRNVLSFDLLSDAGIVVPAVYFGDADEALARLAAKCGQSEVEDLLTGRINHVQMDIIYYPEINEFRGVRNVQIVIRHFK